VRAVSGAEVPRAPCALPDLPPRGEEIAEIAKSPQRPIDTAAHPRARGFLGLTMRVAARHHSRREPSHGTKPHPPLARRSRRSRRSRRPSGSRSVRARAKESRMSLWRARRVFSAAAGWLENTARCEVRCWVTSAPPRQRSRRGEGLAAFFDGGHVEAGEHAQRRITQGPFSGAEE